MVQLLFAFMERGVTHCCLILLLEYIHKGRETLVLLSSNQSIKKPICCNVKEPIIYTP